MEEMPIHPVQLAYNEAKRALDTARDRASRAKPIDKAGAERRYREAEEGFYEAERGLWREVQHRMLD